MAFTPEVRKQIRRLAGNKCEMCGRDNNEFYLDCAHIDHNRSAFDEHSGDHFYNRPENSQLLCLECHRDESDDEWHKQAIQGRIDKYGLRRKTIYKAK